MTDELKFTPEWILRARSIFKNHLNDNNPIAKQIQRIGYEALGEIKQLHAQLAACDAMIVNMVEIGNRIVKIAEPEHRAWEKEQLERWGKLVAEWEETK